jgi:NAD(P)H-dependent flavin oxidoreductase YrpB (nitropropane dioxygenase family)
LSHPALHTPVCDLLGAKLPIVQSAMGWVATDRLVVATARTGVFPFLAVATQSASEAEASIVSVREQTDAPFGVNFLMQQPGADEIVEAIIRHGVRAAGYSRSPVPQLIARLKDNDVVCMPTVGLPKHAVKAVQLGADIVIAQGAEGGGHTGTLATLQLVPQVVQSVDVPVVAAGGFVDGRGLVAALALGASGIAMGTRFLLTAESPVPQSVKLRYLEASSDDTVVSRRIDGLPQRVLRNEALAELETESRRSGVVRSFRSARAYRARSGSSLVDLGRSAVALARDRERGMMGTVAAANAPMLVRRALVEGDAAGGILPAGQAVGRIDDLPTCADLVERIVAGANATLADLAA